jgi:hypothetical protein
MRREAFLKSQPGDMPFFFEAAILSRIRSPRGIALVGEVRRPRALNENDLVERSPGCPPAHHLLRGERRSASENIVRAASNVVTEMGLLIVFC